MRINWTVVTEKHIKEACHLYDTNDKIRPIKKPINTFLKFNNKKYPGKFIRGLAYKIATGKKLDPSNDYSGGMETVRFFKRLNFETEYDRHIIKGSKPKKRGYDHTIKSAKKGKNLDPKKQKIALRKLLEEHFGKIQTEVRFDWLVVPGKKTVDSDLAKIRDALKSYRGFNNFFTPRKSLTCDFYIPTNNTIIEYDERQHFTIPRDISLSNYPKEMILGFDKKEWRLICKKVKAVDSDPEYRDEQRAFYDTLRDILAAKNGVNLKRLKHGEYDWESKESENLIEKLFSASDANRKIRIGRVILDFGKTRSEWLKIYQKYGWDRGRLKTISSHYNKNDSDYKQRIKEIVNLCSENECDLVVFPASTFIYKNKNDISDYRKICKAIPCVISGLLKAGTKRENIAIMKYGRFVDGILGISKKEKKKNNRKITLYETMKNCKLGDNSPVIMNIVEIGFYSLLVAISTNIWKIYMKTCKGEILRNDEFDSKKPMLIFMLGHQQYSSAYIKRSLEKIIRETKDLSNRKRVAIIPYWHWLNSRATYDFIEPKRNLIKFLRKTKRIELEYDDKSDFVDLIDIYL